MSGASELYRPVRVDELPQAGRVVQLKPSADEMKAIAERLDLVSLNALDGDVTVARAMGREVTAEGTIRAEIVQTCVVTGDPLTTTLEFDLQRRYAEDADPFDGLDEDDDAITDPDDDGPDPIENGTIDIGEAAVEELALQVPAYPRTPGAEFADQTQGPAEDSRPENPFAVLAELKNRLKTDD